MKQELLQTQETLTASQDARISAYLGEFALRLDEANYRLQVEPQGWDIFSTAVEEMTTLWQEAERRGLSEKEFQVAIDKSTEYAICESLPQYYIDTLEGQKRYLGAGGAVFLGPGSLPEHPTSLQLLKDLSR